MHIRTLKTLVLFMFACTASLALADPPARVGRISYVQGDVQFRDTYSGESNTAQINWPVTSDNLVTTERDARAAIQVGSASVRIDSDSELEITQLDDEHFDLRLIYGSVYVRIKDPELAHDFTLYTPQGRVLLPEPSRIRIDAERAPDTTTLSVLDGVANMAGDDSTFVVRAGKRAELASGEMRMATLRPDDMQDDFDLWAAARDRRDDQARAVRYVSPETTGYEDLDNYGYWETTSEYGAIWTPRVVAADWAPYRVGHWVWIEPWGWTWVDDAPWGYAPFHYGRWVWFHQRWCWAPGTMVARPVWTPAMVGWIGGSNWSVSFSAGTAPAVGWFPLAPHEVYVPSYRVSPAYIRQVNITHVTNVSNITVVNGFASAPQDTHYRNREMRHAVSVMPHDRFIAHRTVTVTPRTIARVTSPRELEHAPVSAVMPASIAHDNRFARDRDRENNPSRHPSFAAEPHSRFHQPGIRENAPPAVRQPVPQDRNEPRVIRRSEIQIERRVTPSTPPTTQPVAPPVFHAAPNPNQEHRGNANGRPDRHIEPPGILHPGTEMPRPVPQQSPQVPLKKTIPPLVIPGQEERRHHWQENAPRETRPETPPAGAREDRDDTHQPRKEPFGR